MKFFLLQLALAIAILDWSIAASRVLAQKGEPDGGKKVVLCFSEKTTVQALGKGVIPMKELEVGDRVLTGKPKDRYETVYAFGHIHPNKSADFLQIFTSNHNQKKAAPSPPLEMTGNHMVFVDGKNHPVRADSIQVGDKLQTNHGRVTNVTKIKKVTRTGVYAPFTASGSIVVNGIVASTYVSLQGQTAVEYAEFGNGIQIPFFTQEMGSHMWMSPIRLLCLGVSHSFCESNHDEDGFLPWTRLGQDLLEWGIQWNILVQALLFGLGLISLAVLNLVEFVFGPSLSCIILLVGLLTCSLVVMIKKGTAGIVFLSHGCFKNNNETDKKVAA